MPQPAAASVLHDLLTRRHSCRAFLPGPVPRARIERLLTTAQRTASWCNAQAWQVALVQGAPLRDLAERLHAAAAGGVPGNPDFAFPEAYTGVYRDRRRACGFALYDSVGIARGDRAAGARQMLENFRFFGAPHAAILTSRADLGPYGAVDCGGYVANFLNAAEALGLGAIPQAAPASYPDLIREALGLGPDRLVVCAISFGVEDRDHPINRFRTDRAPLDEVVSWFGEAEDTPA